MSYTPEVFGHVPVIGADNTTQDYTATVTTVP